MNGPQCILAWVLGAVLALMDGAVWAELGAAMPEAGGSYVFLRELYGKKTWGNLVSFIFIWQTVIQAPLVMASASIGFAHTFSYLLPLNEISSKLVSGGLVLLMVLLLYRRIGAVGKISQLMWIGVFGTLAWLIFGGLTHFNTKLAFTYPPGAFTMNSLFFVGLGHASLKTIYCYLGYYNVCHLGAEIKSPQKNIPKSIFISIIGIAILYLLMQISILGVLPWQDAANEKTKEILVPLFFKTIYGQTAATIAAILILWIAASSLFALVLGYSRIPYAAAIDGKFFKVFAKTHPTKHFPHVSLMVLGGIGFIFSLLFRLGEVISTIVVMRIIVQFLGQSVGLMWLHSKRKDFKLPFKMWLYPVPVIFAIIIWLFVFFNSDIKYIIASLGVIASGSIAYLIFSKEAKMWPFEPKDIAKSTGENIEA